MLFLYKICDFQFFETCQSLELIIGGVGIKTGGLENFSTINNRGGRLFDTLEYSTVLGPGEGAVEFHISPHQLATYWVRAQTLRSLLFLFLVIF